ncbi:MAG: Uma2 family endonuclease [Actinomycetota bacterium]|nr:Uma2 family endonuclease [Actinomycetota bacterium]
MTEAKIRTEIPPVVLHTRPALDMDEEQFFEFCRLNRDWRIERTADGDLEIMPPTGGETGNRNLKIALQLGQWTERDGTGVAFDSSTGFVLPNGATRSPDASWVRRERLQTLSAEQKSKFPPLSPDFVVELRSPSDPLATVEAKLREYIENGARLGWLIDPETRRAHIHRSNEPVQVLEDPDSLSGDPVLPGFILDLRRIWETGL